MYVISIESFTELLIDIGKSLHCITLHCESLFVPFHWLSSPFLIRRREIRCERDSNHCAQLEVASKASFGRIILVAPEGRGQNTHIHVILQQNCSYHLTLVLCWLWHSMDLLREVRDEREMMAAATTSWSFSLVQNIWSSTHWDKLLVLILHKTIVCRACKISTDFNTGSSPKGLARSLAHAGGLELLKMLNPTN
jgi:hypothetical protein